MSLALIQESAKEVRRLAIAGSGLAPGDFRLKKLIAPLEQAGAKVPVFAQVGKAISDLVNATEAESASRLLALSTLLNAILYTQGQTGVAGELRDLDVTFTGLTSTKTSARSLKPVIAALTSSGGGRLETIKSAWEQGTFADMRLIAPATQALNDSFPEIAEFVADKVLPAYGRGIVPLLQSNLDLKGKRADARKLRVLHHLDPDGTLPLCKQALEEGSADVKAGAIACLGKHESCVPLLLEQAKAKNKTIRAAALDALAEYDRSDVAELLIRLLQGDALDSISMPLRNARSAKVLDALLAEGRKVFELVLEKGEEQLLRFQHVLQALESRKDPAIEEFLLHCFNEGERLSKVKSGPKSVLSGRDLLVQIGTLLAQFNSVSAAEAILARRDALPSQGFYLVLVSAFNAWPAERIHDEFAPLLSANRGAAKEKNDVLQQFITLSNFERASGMMNGVELPKPDSSKWDPRWLDSAIKAKASRLVYCLARPDHKESVDYLLKRCDNVDSFDSFEAAHIVAALIRSNYPQVTEVFVDLVKKKSRIARYPAFQMSYLLQIARELPPADFPKLQAFASQLDEKVVGLFLEAIAPLRPKSESTATQNPHVQQQQ